MNRPHRRERTIDKQARSKSSFFTLPSGQLYNPYRPLEILTPEQVQHIHEASMHILEHTGIRFQDAEALSLWEQAGAKVDHVKQHVWIDRGLLMEWVAKAPQSFTVRARNPQRSRMIGGNAINFFPSAGMVFVRDLGRGHRPGKSSDALDLVKLIQMTNVIDFAPVQSVVMHDVPVHRKHLVDQAMSYIHSDKPLLGTSHGRIIAGMASRWRRLFLGRTCNLSAAR
jgi:trimethylamine--corrinoid protein Co-methyltransferase